MAVFVSSDDGAIWSILGSGLPRVIVHSLKLHRPSRTLRAATFGRSMWDIAVPLGTGPAALGIAKVHKGNFALGQKGATYQITISNQTGAGTTAGQVTVNEIVPHRTDSGIDVR